MIAKTLTTIHTNKLDKGFCGGWGDLRGHQVPLRVHKNFDNTKQSLPHPLINNALYVDRWVVIWDIVLIQVQLYLRYWLVLCDCYRCCCELLICISLVIHVRINANWVRKITLMSWRWYKGHEAEEMKTHKLGEDGAHQRGSQWQLWLKSTMGWLNEE